MKNKKKCVICGKEFPSPPSDKTVTCSPKCRSIRATKAASHKRPDDVRAILSKAAKKRGLSEETQKKGVEAAMKSPKAGRFDTNSSAKEFVILSPEGKEYKVSNLSNWIRNNIEHFGEKEATDKIVRRIAHGFYTIARNTRINRRGQRYKGWIVVEHDLRKNCERLKNSNE